MRNIVLNLQENNLTHWPRRQQSRKTDPHRKRNRYLDFACVGYVFLFDGITIFRGSPSCTWWYWRETLICWAVFQQSASGIGCFFWWGTLWFPAFFCSNFGSHSRFFFCTVFCFPPVFFSCLEPIAWQARQCYNGPILKVINYAARMRPSCRFSAVLR